MDSFHLASNKEGTTVDAYKKCLLDLSEPIAKRTHAAFYLRTNGSVEAVSAIVEALQQREDSELMRHEFAYILGQMQNPLACSVLTSILEDERDDILVRHESAEALGAIGADSSLDVLQRFMNHDATEISETCRIAIDLIKWRKNGESVDKGIYLSVDPAPPLSQGATVQELEATLIDSSQSLFQRYRAMFSLRNMNNDAAALALISGFSDSSALFRHEVAYVLGQMQREVTIDGLAAVLRNRSEHKMVRHEAAEALGAVGGQKVETILKEFSSDDDLVVTQSCEVALDTIEYWMEHN